VDRRHGKNTQFALADPLRQSLYSRLAGYEDVNDAERLAQDPTFRFRSNEVRLWLRLIAYNLVGHAERRGPIRQPPKRRTHVYWLGAGKPKR
jgi:hypothetical protein